MGNNKMIHKLLKGVSVALVAVMVIGAGVVTYSNEAQAAIPTDTQWVTVATSNTYASEKEAPKAADCGLSEGYLFAGWYTAKDGEVYSENVPANATAKFVPAYILGVKSQVAYPSGNTFATDVKEASENVYLRLVSAVDSTTYKEVGFNITAMTHGAQKESQWNTKDNKTTVYSKLTQEGDDVEADAVFGAGAQYFFSYTVRKIPNKDNFDTAFYATPYWVTMDGTKVTGLAKYVHVEDYYKNLISVPVYLNSSTKAAAGIATVAFDDNSLDFYGYENGKLFEEGIAADHKNGTVKCVANVSTLADKEVNGMFINLRFEIKKPEVKTFTFDVTAANEDFCNIEEKLISEVSGGKIVAYDIQY